MRYLLNCPCGQSVSVGRGQAGSEVTCLACGRQLAVPTIRGLEALPIETSPAVERTVGIARPRWSLFRRVLAGVSFATFLIAVLMCLRYGWFWATYRSDWTLVQEQQRIEEIVAEQSLAQLWAAWDLLRREGLNEKLEVPGALTTQLLDRQRPYWIASGVVAMAAAALFVGVIVTAPRRSNA